MDAIKTVAVIGAGKLGRDIALSSALGGYRTILEDILPASLRRAQSEIADSLEQWIASGKISRQEALDALARLEYAGSVEEAARQADLVIEAVPDEMESKLEIFTLLDRMARPHTILASTTTALRLHEIASITYRAQMILGLRFSGGAGTAQQLSVVRGTETGDATIAVGFELGRRMGRQVTVIEEEAS